MVLSHRYLVSFLPYSPAVGIFVSDEGILLSRNLKGRVAFQTFNLLSVRSGKNPASTSVTGVELLVEDMGLISSFVVGVDDCGKGSCGPGALGCDNDEDIATQRKYRTIP